MAATEKLTDEAEHVELHESNPDEGRVWWRQQRKVNWQGGTCRIHLHSSTVGRHVTILYASFYATIISPSRNSYHRLCVLFLCKCLKFSYGPSSTFYYSSTAHRQIGHVVTDITIFTNNSDDRLCRLTHFNSYQKPLIQFDLSGPQSSREELGNGNTSNKT
jgi:hypothetical protein